MRFQGLDLNLLVALNAVLSELNVSRAAERVFLSQSAVSSALGRLREYFGDELVVPVGRKLVMTPLAESLLEPVRDVLLRLEATIATRPTFEAAKSEREFTLVASDYPAVVFVPQLLQRVAEEAPLVRIVLRSGHPIDLLERGEADLLFVPKAWASPDHPCQTVFSDHYVCLAWTGHRSLRETISFDEYLSLGHVAIDHGLGRMPFDNWFLSRFGTKRRVEVTTSMYSSLPSLVVGTQRLATVQARMADANRHLAVQVYAAPMEVPPLVLTIQWHKYRTLDPGIAWLRGIAAAVGEEMGMTGNP